MSKPFKWGSFPFYDHIIIIVQRQIAQVIDKIVGGSFFGGIEVGDKVKIETLVQKAGTGRPSLAVAKGKTIQDTVVLPQPIIDVPYQVFAVLVYFVVIGIAAMVRAVFLIYPAPDFGAAFQTSPCRFQKGVVYFLQYTHYTFTRIP